MSGGQARSHWRLEDLAARMGVSRFTVADHDHDSLGKTLEAARKTASALREHFSMEDRAHDGRRLQPIAS